MPIYLQHGNLIDYVPPTDTSTEDVVFMGGLVGIPQAFIPAGELGALSVDGVYIFNKKDGVSVNLGDVVKYCGTTKLAQDSNADLPLGVAVADAEADDFGVKVKINSVLPSSGGGGGSGGEVALCGDSGLYFDCGDNVAIKYCGCSAINADTNGVYLAVCGDSGLSIQNGMLVACGGGGESGSIGLTENHSFIVTGADSPVDDGNLVNIGYCNKGSSRGSVILGADTDNCSSSYAVVIGSCSNVGFNAPSGIAIGKSAKVKETSCGGIAIGSGAEVAMNGCGSIAIGLNAKSCSTILSRGNIVIGNGINPYSDSALLIIGGNGATGDYREGILMYSSCSNFSSSSRAGIAYVTSEDNGASWASQCRLDF